MYPINKEFNKELSSTKVVFTLGSGLVGPELGADPTLMTNLFHDMGENPQAIYHSECLAHIVTGEARTAEEIEANGKRNVALMGITGRNINFAGIASPESSVVLRINNGMTLNVCPDQRIGVGYLTQNGQDYAVVSMTQRPMERFLLNLGSPLDISEKDLLNMQDSNDIASNKKVKGILGSRRITKGTFRLDAGAIFQASRGNSELFIPYIEATGSVIDHKKPVSDFEIVVLADEKADSKEYVGKAKLVAAALLPFSEKYSAFDKLKKWADSLK